LLGLSSLLLIIVLCAAFSFTKNDDFGLAKQEILLRKIGHEVLLRAGDSTSRVLPVTKKADNEYQIRFENEFTFQADSLVAILGRALADNNVSEDYIVNVLDCSGQQALFGYAILKNEQKNIVPCSGRKQPKGCYLIDLKFQPAGVMTIQKGYLIGGVSLFAVLGLLIASPFRARRNRDETTGTESNTCQVGNTFYDAARRTVMSSGIVTELTPKENKLMGILAAAPDTIIERSRLQKEIWEDEGVIVGRSLDVFISKLRKKLENDPSIQLANIHGKGYRLETGNMS
jgi:hypothetical protein